ncbi:MFS transporter [Planomonospora parontospora]|uniref:MFS transporter n=1 Tax=Planomonospora parontospora TaxID=58119 RepID=UPI0019424713|nr:MFS transporter [Planomonospora parontospora]GGL15108.1 MFS transporter [Planomonospora parontospora subsp. antibiotica]GII15916.1 MFS transporter [Planomonospora parontospora subsp. antibiotica]
MIIYASRAPGTRANRLAAAVYVYTFLDEFILLYPVYALLFVDTGLSVAEISSLFVIWSVTGIVLEVPSGVWADAVSRRLLLVLAPLPAAAGYALWVAAPSYWAFALGFVLWGIRGAMASGAFEALVYEELDRLGEAGRYARVIGRAEVVAMCAVAAATAAASPVFAAGGHGALGAASVLACLLCSVAGLAFPEHRARRSPARGGDPVGPVGPVGLAGRTDPSGPTGSVDPVDPPEPNGPNGPDGPHEEDGPDGLRRYAAVLRVGLAEVRDDRSVRRALLLVPATAAVWGALEEYVALLAQETGVPGHAVPLWVLLVWSGVTAGALLAGAGHRLGARGFAALLGLGALALAGGALSGRPGGLAAVAAAFCVFQLASVTADARLQDRITGPSRATVTSLASLGTGLATVLVYGLYAAASAFAGHGVVFALFAVPYGLLALVPVRRALRRRGCSPRP